MSKIPDNIDGNILLHLFAQIGEADALEELLKSNRANIDHRSSLGQTALMAAVNCDHVDVVLRLIKLGTDINAIDQFGNTALMVAAAKGDTEITAILIKAGAALDVRDMFGETALLAALSWDQPATARQLIEAGCDTSIINQQWEDARSMAEKSGMHDIVTLIDDIKKAEERAAIVAALARDADANAHNRNVIRKTVKAPPKPRPPGR